MVRAAAGAALGIGERVRSDERGGYATLRLMRATTADRAQPAATAYLICAAAWLLPGLGHLWLGRRQKGIALLIALTLMFAFGLWLEGALFPFQLSEPLVALGAFADLGIGLPYFIARATEVGAEKSWRSPRRTATRS